VVQSPGLHMTDQRSQERDDFDPTENRAHPPGEDAERSESGARSPNEAADDASDWDDPRIPPGAEPPGETSLPAASVGEAPRGAGQDRIGGYGNAPVPQEPGPDEDEGLAPG
jgi:hypothetical protein